MTTAQDSFGIPGTGLSVTYAQTESGLSVIVDDADRLDGDGSGAVIVAGLDLKYDGRTGILKVEVFNEDACATGNHKQTLNLYDHELAHTPLDETEDEEGEEDERADVRNWNSFDEWNDAFGEDFAPKRTPTQESALLLATRPQPSGARQSELRLLILSGTP